MIAVDIRQLRSNLVNLLRHVQEDGEVVVVDADGVPIARLVPAAASAALTPSAIWTTLDALAAEIDAEWPEGVNVVSALRQDRAE